MTDGAQHDLDSIAAACGDRMPLPPTGDEPVFAAPWQAQAFAMTVALNEAGHLPWTEWAQALSARVGGGQADGSDYYEQWLAALQDVLEAKQLVAADAVRRTTQDWHDAAARTPHGRPITLGQGRTGRD